MWRFWAVSLSSLFVLKFALFGSPWDMKPRIVPSKVQLTSNHKCFSSYHTIAHLLKSRSTGGRTTPLPARGFHHQFSAPVLGGGSEVYPGRCSQSCWLSGRLKERSGCAQARALTQSRSSWALGTASLRFRGVGALGTERTQRPGRPPASWGRTPPGRPAAADRVERLFMYLQTLFSFC